jgi:hypothetical protein
VPRRDTAPTFGLVPAGTVPLSTLVSRTTDLAAPQRGAARGETRHCDCAAVVWPRCPSTARAVPEHCCSDANVRLKARCADKTDSSKGLDSADACAPNRLSPS